MPLTRCLLVLIALNLAASTATSEDVDDSTPNFLLTETEPLVGAKHTASRKEREMDVDRWMAISNAVADAREVAANPISYSTVYDLAGVYDKIADLRPGSYPVADNLADVVADFIDITWKIMLAIVDERLGFENAPFPSTVVRVFSSEKGLFMDPNYEGVQLFQSATVDISELCMINLYVSVGLVVWPKNACPLRPLPIVNGSVTSFNVVHVARVPTTLLYREKECETKKFFHLIILRFHGTSGAVNLLYGCAQWFDGLGWSSEYCFTYKKLGESGYGECHCDTMLNKGTVEFLVYEYTEDVADLVKIKVLNVTAKSASDISEIRSQEKSLVALGLNNEITSAMFETLIGDILFNIMQFDTSVLIGNCRSSILDDIGRVVEAVKPTDGSGVIGRGNQLLYSVVFDLTTYQHDPLLAFSFYNSSTHAVDMEYLRSTDREDYNRIFYHFIEYSLLFSKSVVAQNSRYAFILYPLQKYFREIVTVNGIEVVAGRVLDVFLAPVHDSDDSQEQMLHMFFNPDPGRMFYSGCAYWSDLLKAWTDTGCFPNSDLYLGVCTCKMNVHFAESRTRGQYLAYKYPIFDSGSVVLKYDTNNLLAIWLFGLHNLASYYRGKRISDKALQILNDVYMLEQREVSKLSLMDAAEVVNEARIVLLTDVTLNSENLASRATLCIDSFGAMGGSPWNPIVSEWGGLDFYCVGDYKQDDVDKFISLEDFFGLAIHMSESLKAQNDRFALLIHPTNYNMLHPLPEIGQRILKSHVVDVLRSPAKFDVEQKEVENITILIYERHYNCSLGCAVWDDNLSMWTAVGCVVTLVHGQDSCECNVTGDQPVTQFLVYTFNDVVLDEQVYKRVILGSDPYDLDDFNGGAELLHNITLFPVVKDSFLYAMRIYMRILSLDDEILEENQNTVSHLLEDMDLVVSDYQADSSYLVDVFFGIHGSQSLKSVDIATDLFSNAVLSAEDPSEIAKTTDMSIVALGFYTAYDEPADDRPQGFYCDGDSTEQLVALRNHDALVEVFSSNPSFVCFVVHRSNLAENRVVFVVYPLNKTPYPLTMTVDAIFNVRQVDVHVGGDKRVTEFVHGDAIVDLYFHETAVMKWYMKIACASWDELRRAWSTEVCSAFAFQTSANASVELCRCNVTGRRVTRVALYEHTHLANFSLSTVVDGTTIVFLIGAVLSMFGLLVIVMTAIFFPKWREELGNKIMMNLTASTYIYLLLTVYRETHLIYADSNHDSIALIVFTVCVHYSRLTHFCWGLVMSILQYKRFSGVVGASTISHLLLKVSLLAWGAPMIPLAILLTWQQSVHFCSPDKVTHYILYLVPGVVITLLNIGLMAAIIRTITNGCGLWRDDELVRHGVDNKDLLMRRLKQTVMMFFLFGIPAVFEMFNDIGADSHSVVLDYINNVLDPIQGFVLFLFFVVIDEKTRGYWYERIYGKEVVIAGQATTKKMPIKLQFVKSRSGPRAKPAVENGGDGEMIAMEVLESGAVVVQESDAEGVGCHMSEVKDGDDGGELD